MKILGIDTSGSALSVALLDGDRLQAEYLIDHGLTHSQRLMPLLDKLLRDCGAAVAEMDAFAVAKGPGSFTGLRIGVATVKALGFAEKKPVVGVSTLEALCYHLPEADGVLCPMLDARNAQTFAAVYRWRDGQLEEVLPPQAIPVQELCARLQEYDEAVWLLGDGAAVYEKTLKETLGARAKLAPPPLRLPRASSVAWAAKQALEAGEPAEGKQLKPEYLRKSQAEQEKARREKQEGEKNDCNGK